jgi:hypothetical protein
VGRRQGRERRREWRKNGGGVGKEEAEKRRISKD